MDKSLLQLYTYPPKPSIRDFDLLDLSYRLALSVIMFYYLLITRPLSFGVLVRSHTQLSLYTTRNSRRTTVRVSILCKGVHASFRTFCVRVHTRIPFHALTSNHPVSSSKRNVQSFVDDQRSGLYFFRQTQRIRELRVVGYVVVFGTLHVFVHHDGYESYSYETYRV